VITLQGDHPDLVQQMIFFLYACDYWGIHKPLDFNPAMYAIAAKYDVVGLKELARNKFAHQLDFSENPSKMPIPEFIQAIKAV